MQSEEGEELEGPAWQVSVGNLGFSRFFFRKKAPETHVSWTGVHSALSACLSYARNAEHSSAVEGANDVNTSGLGMLAEGMNAERSCTLFFC